MKFVVLICAGIIWMNGCLVLNPLLASTQDQESTQQQEFQVGQTVVVIEDTELRNNDGPQGEVFAGLPVTIQQIHGDTKDDGTKKTYLLVTYRKSGWLDSQFVRTPEMALEYFESKISSDEDNKVDWIFPYAMTLAALDRHEEAINEFTRLLDKEPEKLAYLNERAGSLMELGKFEDAIKDFDAMIEKQPQPIFYNNRAICRRALKDVDGARKDYQKALELEPNLIMAMISLGSLEEEQGNVDAALEQYSSLVNTYPRMPRGYLLRADLLLRNEKLEKALADFETLIQLQPKLEVAYRNKGIILKSLGKQEEAFKAFSKMIERFPESPVGYVNRGVMLEASEKYEEALRDFSKFLKYSPNHPFGLFHRGCVHIALNDYEAAVRDLTKAIEAEPKTIALVRRGEAYSNWGKQQEAIQDFSQALTNDAEQHFARYRRAISYQASGELDNALADLNTLIDKGVVSHEIYYSRSRVLLAQKSFQAALSDMEKAIEMSPDAAGILNDYAWQLATLGDEELRDPDRAIELATKACELTQWKAGVIIDTLATSYAANGDFAKAVELEEQALKLDDAKSRQSIKDRLELFRNEQPFINKS